MPLLYIAEALGGLGLFILGMKSMSEGMQKLAGDKLRHYLEKIAANRLTAALMGSCLASFLQSSSAASILVIGFVNAGLVSLYQALGMLLGTGIGTTLAVQFIAFRISFLALPAIFVGVLLKYFGRRRRWVYLGEIALGAGLLFLGLQVMEANFAPIQQTAIFREQQLFLSWRVSAALLGALLTFLVQSSSAAIGIIMALAGGGLLPFETGAAMVVGEVLGTSCIAAIATIGGTLESRRTVAAYFIINLFAVSMVMVIFPFFMKVVLLISPTVAQLPVNPNISAYSSITLPISRQLANAHTLFSVMNAIVFLPLIGFFARSATTFLQDRYMDIDTEPRAKFLDVKVLNTPTIAFLQAKNELRRMSGITRTMFEETVEQFHKYDAKSVQRIIQKENVLDVLQRDISTFLVSLSRQPLSSEHTIEIPIMLHIVNYLETIGDQSEAALHFLQKKKEERLLFSNTAMNELRLLAMKVAELVVLATDSVEFPPPDAKETGRCLLQSVHEMQDSMHTSHIKRLSSGKCAVPPGLIYSDIITSFVKIAESSQKIIVTKTELKL